MDINALVVDDSGIMRKLVMRNLTESEIAQFTFTEAKDGVDGLEKLDPKNTDMIFLDWNMPNMNGIEFVRRVRNTIEEHIPIVMITTEGTMGKIEETLDDAGADGYIVKPFTVDILRKKLKPILEEMGKGKKKSGGFFGKLAKAI